jgi:hypothetical protein
MGDRGAVLTMNSNTSLISQYMVTQRRLVKKRISKSNDWTTSMGTQDHSLQSRNKPNCAISSGFAVTYCTNVGLGLAGRPLVGPSAQRGSFL